MAAKHILPGFGGKVTTESIAGGSVSADEYDMSRCAQFAVQLSAVTGSPTLQVEQTIDGTNWASLGSTIANTLGTIVRFGAFSGPYAKIRFKVTGGGTAATFALVGYEMQGRA